jgi:bacillithiol synthase
MEINFKTRMFRATAVDHSSSIGLQRLVQDYIGQSSQLSDFYDHPPTIEGFRRLLADKPYERFDRKKLSGVLLKQAGSVENTSELSIRNIKALNEAKVYTVTTGHQLCLFTGPLYFIYKICSVIKLSQRLSEEIKDARFVPVFWLASEDHDFAEVNYMHVFGKKIEWHSGQSGAVGNFKTAELAEVKDQFATVVGDSTNAKTLVSLFEKAYLQHKTLAQATRFLVNSLFGEYGLVIADGQDAELKQEFKKEFGSDVLEQLAYKNVSETVTRLKKLGYEAQVNPREVNVFYLAEGVRARIDKKAEGYEATGTGQSWSREEMRALIEQEPQKLSPNVTLRPAYQQKVLPNIAYIGGAGELAYWLEYKAMFDKLDLLFPVLVLRDSFTVLDQPTITKMEKLGVNIEDLFQEEDKLIMTFQAKHDRIFSAAEEKKALTGIFDRLSEKIKQVDQTLQGSTAAELQKGLKSLEALEAKANRALKAKSETELNQLRALRAKVYPEGIPQERHENFSSLYLRHGNAFIGQIIEQCDVFRKKHLVLSEETN